MIRLGRFASEPYHSASVLMCQNRQNKAVRDEESSFFLRAKRIVAPRPIEPNRTSSNTSDAICPPPAVVCPERLLVVASTSATSSPETVILIDFADAPRHDNTSADIATSITPMHNRFISISSVFLKPDRFRQILLSHLTLLVYHSILQKRAFLQNCKHGFRSAPGCTPPSR